MIDATSRVLVASGSLAEARLIQVGHHVLCHRRGKYSTGATEVTGVEQTMVGKVYELTLANGNKLRCSGDTEVLIRTMHGKRYIPATKLYPGQSVYSKGVDVEGVSALVGFEETDVAARVAMVAIKTFSNDGIIAEGMVIRG